MLYLLEENLIRLQIGICFVPINLPSPFYRSDFPQMSI